MKRFNHFFALSVIISLGNGADDTNADTNTLMKKLNRTNDSVLLHQRMVECNGANIQNLYNFFGKGVNSEWKYRC